jgi:2-phospho-L-lactate transferase/gluconeogenesis factor (CofD/UPF0052 family)
MNDQTDHLNKLDQIALLEEGWNGNGAKAFETELIDKVKRMIAALQQKPEVFPTACDSIQLEFEKEDGSYLEIEVSSQDSCQVFEMDANGKETIFLVEADIEAIRKIVNCFYGRG